MGIENQTPSGSMLRAGTDFFILLYSFTVYRSIHDRAGDRDIRIRVVSDNRRISPLSPGTLSNNMLPSPKLPVNKNLFIIKFIHNRIFWFYIRPAGVDPPAVKSEAAPPESGGAACFRAPTGPFSICQSPGRSAG